MWNRSEDKINCIFIRHGSTASNREHRYLGKTDEALDTDGERAIYADVINQRYPSCDIVFSSPLTRCIQTAGIIYPDQKPVIIDELSEMDFGDFELKNYSELSTDPRYREDYQAWIDSGGITAFPNGESRQQFINRSVSGFERAVSGIKSAATVAFVVHGGTIMALLSRYVGGDYFDYQVKNGGGYVCTILRQDNKIIKGKIQKSL